MEHLPGEGKGAYILGGDLNTNGFGRGTPWRTVRSIARLVFHPASSMREAMLHPERGREPLFKVLKKHGFSWEGFNSGGETARAAIDSIEEAMLLPEFLKNWIKARLEPYNGFLCFKLDWLTGKQVQALKRGQKRDIPTGVVSMEPACLKGDNSSPSRPSDHLPIYADLIIDFEGASP
jgi:hypothetical protein